RGKKTHSSALDPGAIEQIKNRLGGESTSDSKPLPELDLPTRERPRASAVELPRPSSAAVPTIPRQAEPASGASFRSAPFRPPLKGGGGPWRPPVARPASPSGDAATSAGGPPPAAPPVKTPTTSPAPRAAEQSAAPMPARPAAPAPPPPVAATAEARQTT